MKKIAIVACAFLMMLLSACGPTQNEAVKYNDSIMKIIDALAIEHTLFLDQIDGHNVDSLKLTHDHFVAKAKESLEASKKIGPFGDKTEFIDVTLDYFKVLNSIANTEGTQMVEIMSKDSAQITQEDLDKIDVLAAKFDEDYGKVYDKISAAQEKFAKEWKFELIEGKK
jgi:hypothetical protein